MLKINLSDQDGKKPERNDSPDVVPETTMVAGKPDMNDTMSGTLPEDESSKSASGGGRRMMPLLALVLVVALAALAYMYRGTLMSLFSSPAEDVQPVEAPAPAPEPVEMPVEMTESEPDPTFILLNTISDVMPPRVWLTEVVLSFDGTYHIKGMSFAHEAMGVLSAGLSSIGTVTDSYFPRKTDSAETIYRFTVSGQVDGFIAPDLLDVIPAGVLTSFAAPVIDAASSMGVTFTSVPESGAMYNGDEMPFALKGSFTGLKQVIGAFADRDPDVRVYQLVIVPDAVGMPFDRVDATFSLRTQSSI